MTTKLATTVLLLAALAVASAEAGWGSTTSTTSQPRVLRLVGVDESFTSIGVSETAPQKIGDRFLFTTGLYHRGSRRDRPNGKRIGRGTSLCTVTAADGREIACSGSLRLPGGYILIEGALRPAGRVHVAAVIGGVGHYANARGTAAFHLLKRTPDGAETDAIIVRLVP